MSTQIYFFVFNINYHSSIVHNTYFVTVIKDNDEDIHGTIERSWREPNSAEKLVIFSLRRVGRQYDSKIYHGRGRSRNSIMQLG